MVDDSCSIAEQHADLVGRSSIGSMRRKVVRPYLTEQDGDTIGIAVGVVVSDFTVDVVLAESWDVACLQDTYCRVMRQFPVYSCRRRWSPSALS